MVMVELPVFSVLFYPPTQKATVFETVDECVEGTLRSSYERSGVCFGGFRPTKNVEEPRASARGGSTITITIHYHHLYLQTQIATSGQISPQMAQPVHSPVSSQTAKKYP